MRGCYATKGGLRRRGWNVGSRQPPAVVMLSVFPSACSPWPWRVLGVSPYGGWLRVWFWGLNWKQKIEVQGGVRMRIAAQVARLRAVVRCFVFALAAGLDQWSEVSDSEGRHHGTSGLLWISGRGMRWREEFDSDGAGAGLN